jgi:hypothetical protein
MHRSQGIERAALPAVATPRTFTCDKTVLAVEGRRLS